MAVRDTSSAVNRVLCRQGYTSGGAGCVFFFRGTHNVWDELQLSHFVG